MSDSELEVALQFACQASGTRAIERGRSMVLRLPRSWVVENVEQVAASCLDLDDEWEYRRLLDLYDKLAPTLVEQLVRFGLSHPNPEIVEAAEDWPA